MVFFSRALLGAFLCSSIALVAQPLPKAASSKPNPPVLQDSSLITQDTTAFGDRSYEMDALRRWLNDKRLITVKELGGDLSLSGEVRTEFQATAENKEGIRQRGQGGATKKPAYAWDVELNLMLDYRTDYTWAAMKIEFDNDMSIPSGSSAHKIRVEKAYLGGRFVAGDTFTLDGEIGRRYFTNVFDSRIEFGALFDGVLLRFSKAFESIGDYYFNTGAFLIEDMDNHYGYVGEMGMLRIANVGLGAKYSVIDWKKHFSNDIKNLHYNFVVQQFLLFYQLNPQWMNKKLIKFYAAGLSNLIADNLVLFNPTTNQNQNFGRQNWGWYAGVSLGQVKKQSDWAIDMNFQWVQAQTVPSFDFLGIGRGNAANVGLYATSKDGPKTTTQTAVGPCNYYGFDIDLLYAFTDNLTIEENFKWSRTLNTDIGPNLQYQQFEIEFIYAF